MVLVGQLVCPRFVKRKRVMAVGIVFFKVETLAKEVHATDRQVVVELHVL